jgi:hypothetical protein
MPIAAPKWRLWTKLYWMRLCSMRRQQAGRRKFAIRSARAGLERVRTGTGPSLQDRSACQSHQFPRRRVCPHLNSMAMRAYAGSFCSPTVHPALSDFIGYDLNRRSGVWHFDLGIRSPWRRDPLIDVGGCFSRPALEHLLFALSAGWSCVGPFLDLLSLLGEALVRPSGLLYRSMRHGNLPTFAGKLARRTPWLDDDSQIRRLGH